MITENDIIETLRPINGIFFNIPILQEYAKKVLTFGKYEHIKQEDTLISYVLYYDNMPQIFISMVWTNPIYQRQGFATQLINKIIQSSHKNICLEVHKNNYGAEHIYKKLGFIQIEQRGDLWFMCLNR